MQGRSDEKNNISVSELEEEYVNNDGSFFDHGNLYYPGADGEAFVKEYKYNEYDSYQLLEYCLGD